MISLFRSVVDCHDPAPIANGQAILSTNATYYGAAVLYECAEHFRLDGVSRRICLEDGTWGYEAPVCRQITCDDPDLSVDLIVEPAENSTTTTGPTNETSSSSGRAVGSLAHFRCPRGRRLIGHETRTCLPNGRWTGRSPICQPVDCGRPTAIENGRVIVVNNSMAGAESTQYGGAAEYHCVPGYARIGPYLRKCMDDALWSGTEPRCELVASNEAQESGGLGTGIAIGAAVIVILLVLIGLVVLHRNKARPVKNTENVQAAETKEDQNAAVMSYSSLEGAAAAAAAAAAGRRENGGGGGAAATFNTFHPAARNGADARNNNAGGNRSTGE